MLLPVGLTLRSSRILAVLLVATHTGALLVVGHLEISFWIKLVALLSIAMSAWHCRKHWLGSRRIAVLSLRDKGALAYVRMDGESGDACVHRQTTVTTWLTVILLGTANGLEPLVVLPDALDPGEYRRLRVWLRWHSATRQ